MRGLQQPAWLEGYAALLVPHVLFEGCLMSIVA